MRKCLLVLVFIVSLVISAYGEGFFTSGPAHAQTVQTDTPVQITIPTASGVEIPGFPWSGSSNENSNAFQINGKLALTWQCQSSGVQPFEIQVWQKGSGGGNDTPVGQPVIDDGANCPGGQTGQTIDFQGNSFIGYLGVTAIGPWTIDAATLSS